MTARLWNVRELETFLAQHDLRLRVIRAPFVDAGWSSWDAWRVILEQAADSPGRLMWTGNGKELLEALDAAVTSWEKGTGVKVFDSGGMVVAAIEQTPVSIVRYEAGTVAPELYISGPPQEGSNMTLTERHEIPTRQVRVRVEWPSGAVRVLDIIGYTLIPGAALEDARATLVEVTDEEAFAMERRGTGKGGDHVP